MASLILSSVDEVHKQSKSNPNDKMTLIVCEICHFVINEMSQTDDLP